MQTTITHNGKEFKIDQKHYDERKELVNLILNTESIDDDERQYWFDIMPVMKEDQKERLFNILESVRKRLKELEEKYKKALKDIMDDIDTLNIDTLSSNSSNDD